MAFTYIPEYSGTNAGLNIDVKGVSIAEGFAAQDINNAMRAMLQQEKQELATLDTVASAGTIDITASGGWTVSGTTTITAMTVKSGSRRILHFQGALTLTHNATSLILPGGANITTAAGDCLSLVATADNQVRITNYMKADGTAVVVTSQVLPIGYLSGLNLSNNGSDAVNDIDITAGEARDATDAVDLSPAAMTKRLDATWTAGTNQGFRDTADNLTGAKWFHVWAFDGGSGSDDFFASTSLTPTLPNSGVYKRRIGEIYWDGSTIKPFTEVGVGRSREFWWTTPVQDRDDVNPGTSANLRVITAPLGVSTKAMISAGGQASTSGNSFNGYISSPSAVDVAPLGLSAAASAAPGGNFASAQVGGNWLWSRLDVWTDTSSQVRVRISASAAATRAAIVTYGWADAL